MEMDLIIVMGAQIFDYQLETFKRSGPNKKVVSYKCGNNYVIHMENILFKPSENKSFQYEKQYDEKNSGSFGFSDFGFCTYRK